ncbi:MAG: alpha/beta hydrolase [Alphaproteobacteria bacterium]|nr:alpha/beta hydrolase [Alphaproteobacteria bacterium]NDC56048.1 alpha/beta hydrolase [Alphaproteobacteria bacterium]
MNWQPQTWHGNGHSMMVYRVGQGHAQPVFVWAHGWGQNAHCFLPLMHDMQGMGQHVMIDFPGFGQSPPPPQAWDVSQYADCVAEALNSAGINGPLVWVGHSFGCRVGVHVAAKKLLPLQHMFLLACPGLPYARPLIKQIKLSAKRIIMRAARVLPHNFPLRAWLREKLGSADYQQAGVMRPTLIKVLQDDLTSLVPRILCPTTLIYGDADIETPPAIGKKFCALRPKTRLHELQGYDHLTILTDARFQVSRIVRENVKGLVE